MKDQKKIKIAIEGFGRWAGFSEINNLRGQIEGEIFDEIYRQVKKRNPDVHLHNATCGIKQMDKRSITLDKYLTDKIIKYRIVGDLKVEAELIDDANIDRKTWKKLRKIFKETGIIPHKLVRGSEKIK